MAALVGPAAGWRLEHYLLADLWQATAQSKKPHPRMPTRAQLERATGSSQSKSARQDQRLRAQQRRIERARANREA